MYRHVGRRYHRYNNDCYHDTAGFQCRFGRLELVLTKMQQPDTTEGGKGNEHRVDEEQVEGSEEIQPMNSGQSEACRTQRWHQCSGNGYTWYDVTLTACTEGYDACRTATEGDKHIVECGRCACQQFRLRLT